MLAVNSQLCVSGSVDNDMFADSELCSGLRKKSDVFCKHTLLCVCSRQSLGNNIFADSECIL